MNKMEFYGYHGAFAEENKLGQRFYVDVELEADLSKAAASDDLAESVDYAEVYETVKSVVEGPPFNLVEAIVQAVLNKIFQAFSIVERATVKVIKPDPPIPGHYDSVAVEMTRERG